MMQLLMFMVLLFAIVVPAEARHPHPCNTAISVKNMLDSRYNETVRFAGITGRLIAKFYVSDNGSWTLVYISPDGVESCIMASGEAWHEVPWTPGQKS